MNSDQIAGKWKQMKGAVKQQWGKLTDDDLDVIAGQSQILAGKLQERYGMAKDEAQRTASEWMNSYDSTDAKSASATNSTGSTRDPYVVGTKP